MLLHNNQSLRLLRSMRCHFAKKSSSEPSHGIKKTLPKRLVPNSVRKKSDWVKIDDEKTGEKHWLHIPSGETSQIEKDEPTAQEFANSLWSSLAQGAGIAVAFGIIIRIFS